MDYMIKHYKRLAPPLDVHHVLHQLSCSCCLPLCCLFWSNNTLINSFLFRVKLFSAYKHWYNIFFCLLMLFRFNFLSFFIRIFMIIKVHPLLEYLFVFIRFFNFYLSDFFLNRLSYLIFGNIKNIL